MTGRAGFAGRMRCAIGVSIDAACASKYCILVGLVGTIWYFAKHYKSVVFSEFAARWDDLGCTETVGVDFRAQPSVLS